MRREDSEKEESDMGNSSDQGLKEEDIEKLDAIFSNMKFAKSSSETSSVPSSLPGLTRRGYASSSYSGDSILNDVADILLDEILDDPSVQEVREQVANKLTELDEYLFENLLMDAGRTIPKFLTGSV
ncbi:predicted protein [Chaetoceros tenuissimus]|uniref:Uncharacterized protein n=1 Tax=Chaetoceros tenuissimus TaxID=426638 RepID=A0AAD3HFF1_9STRA|nr:predicted protein [Chaetoceros tenuissimus]